MRGSFIFVALAVVAVFTTIAPESYAQGGPQGGFVRDFAIHPSAPATIYAGTEGGGIFKSTDGGTSWQPTGASMAGRFGRLNPAGDWELKGRSCCAMIGRNGYL